MIESKKSDSPVYTVCMHIVIKMTYMCSLSNTPGCQKSSTIILFVVLDMTSLLNQ